MDDMYRNESAIESINARLKEIRTELMDLLKLKSDIVSKGLTNDVKERVIKFFPDMASVVNKVPSEMAKVVDDSIINNESKEKELEKTKEKRLIQSKNKPS